MSVCRQYVEALPDSEVTTIFIQGEPDPSVEAEVGGANVIFMERPDENLRGFKFSQIFRLYDLIKSQQFETVVAHRYKAIYLAGIMSYFLSFKVLLGVAHEHKAFKRITRKLFVTFWRKQFYIAGVSKSVVEDIANYCPSLVTRNRLLQLPNILPNDFSKGLLSKQEAREALSIEPDAFVIGSTGRLIKKKSFDVLLTAFAKLKQDNLQLVIVGDGPLRDDLERQALELGIADRTNFLGFVKNAGRYARLFDGFVLPSGGAEAFGLVLLEAMIAKVPVVASTAPGPAEVINQPGWLFEEGDGLDLSTKLQQLIELNGEEKQHLLDENAERVQTEFSLTSFKQRLSTVLN